jgi:hypothetical protein
LTPAELNVVARRWLNDETAATYKWTIAELVDYFNFTMDDIARDTEYFKDAYTAAVTEIAVSAGTPSYALSALLYDIKNVRITGNESPLIFQSVQELTDMNSNWMYTNSIYGTDISFADTNPDTIISTTTEFATEGLSDDDWIQINGSTSNNTNVQIETVAEHLLTLKTAATLTTEAAGDPVSIRVLNTGDPTAYTLGYRTGYITLFPCPEEAETLFIETSRYQLVPLTVATLGSLSIPIDSHYHLGLVDGMCKYAYLKSGPSSFNIEKSNIHAGRFFQFLSNIKKDLINQRSSRAPAAPHEGNI